MTTKPAPPEKPIPAWVFVLTLVVCIGGLGWFQLNRQVKRRAEPVVSEIQALNQTGQRDSEGELSDWIEIWNPTDHPLQLEGYFLTDNLRELKKWRFPKRTVEAGKFLVVFASGKNIAREFGELHTNFRLDPEGEYLALVSTNGNHVVQEFQPKYPKQFGDISYGIRPEIFNQKKARLTGGPKDMTPLLLPTPGSPNQIEMLGLVADTKFSLNRSFLFSRTNVALSVKTLNADIRYTVDGSSPTATNGVLYAGPINIDRTTTLRAVAYRSGFKPSNVDSHTFIFPEQIARELNPERNADADDQVVNGLVEMPSLSLTIPNTNSWRTPGNDRGQRASLEIIDPSGSGNKQAGCGVRLSDLGPSPFGLKMKNSFHLQFDAEFGDPELKHDLFGGRKPRAFRGLLLWGGISPLAGGNGLTAQLSDAWVRTTMLELGLPAPRSRFVNLYVNVAYRGVYSLLELPETTYLATEPRSEAPRFDVRTGAAQLLGDSTAWDELMARANNQSPDSSDVFNSLAGRVNMDAFIDFMLVHFFTGTTDLDRDGNWIAIRPRRKSGPFEFVTTMNPNPMTDWSVDPIAFDDNQSPSRLFQALRRDAMFCKQFAKRAGELLGSGGALSEEEASRRFRVLTKQIGNAATAESLRWGDGGDGLETFFKKRPGEFKKQLESAGLWK